MLRFYAFEFTLFQSMYGNIERTIVLERETALAKSSGGTEPKVPAKTLKDLSAGEPFAGLKDLANALDLVSVKKHFQTLEREFAVRGSPELGR